MIEAKGGKGRLCKLDKLGGIELVRSDGSRAAIVNYAVNGAVHYANAILDGGEYQEVLATGLNGWEEREELKTECEIYYVSEDNAREPKLLAQYKSLDCLAASNLPKLFEELNSLSLTAEEREALKRDKREQLESKIKDIHQSIYDDGDLKTLLGTNDKLYLFSGLIMAALPIEGDADLATADLKGNRNESDHDGARILNRVRAFLAAKHSQADKREMILNLLDPVFKNEFLWKPANGESKIKAIYRKIYEEVAPILKLRLNVDFTGIILNSLKDWMELENDKRNDVVLTPRQVTDLMARLCRTNKGQSSPDFWLNASNKNEDWLEVKSFTGSPNFDISAYNSYINLIIDQPYKLQSNYLLIKYKMNGGIVTIEDCWLKKIWEISCPSSKWPVKVQDKRGTIFNLRPATWYSEKTDYPVFKSIEHFLSALEETVYKYPDTHAKGATWADKLKQSYKNYYGIDLQIPRWMDIKSLYGL